jgi:hypothetical protein
VRIPMVFDAPESGLYRYAQSGLELAHRFRLTRCNYMSVDGGRAEVCH